jgi:tRNA-2-methylthio-N6-dimethylallyladenosine synthase
MEKDYSKYFTPSLKDARKRINKETQIINYDLKPSQLELGKNYKYMIKTYGCQGNLADSEKMCGILEAMGYVETEHEEEADLLLLNTCAIRENAENRVFGELGRLKSLKKHNPNMLLGICGCMPQEEKVTTRIREKMPYVDLVFGTHNIAYLGSYVEKALYSLERVIEVYSKEGDIIENIPTKRDHTKKAWVNIMYGCDEFCTYCIVPYTRGKERSRKPESIIAEVEELVQDGYVEVTLLGQNVNAYGKDFTDQNYTFANLLDDLNKIDIKRIRFTTSHPRDLDDETIAVLAKRGNIMPHLHLPVQSGSNNILKRMNRKYTYEQYVDKISKLRTMIPDISITTDIIVGFPGETEEEFEATLKLVKEADFEGAFTFIFSPREGTPAAKYEDETPDVVKKERLQTLNKLVNEGFLKGNKRFEDSIVKVLVDGFSKSNESILAGYTEHNKLVNFKGDISMIGQIVDVHITKAFTWHLQGDIIK